MKRWQNIRKITTEINTNGLSQQDLASSSNETVDYELSRRYPITLEEARRRALRSIKRDRECAHCGLE